MFFQKLWVGGSRCNKKFPIWVLLHFYKSFFRGGPVLYPRPITPPYPFSCVHRWAKGFFYRQQGSSFSFVFVFLLFVGNFSKNEKTHFGIRCFFGKVASTVIPRLTASPVLQFKWSEGSTFQTRKRIWPTTSTRIYFFAFLLRKKQSYCHGQKCPEKTLKSILKC